MKTHWERQPVQEEENQACGLSGKPSLEVVQERGTLEPVKCWCNVDAQFQRRKDTGHLHSHDWMCRDCSDRWLKMFASGCGDESVTGKGQEKMKSEHLETEIHNSWGLGQNEDFWNQDHQLWKELFQQREEKWAISGTDERTQASVEKMTAKH